MTVTRKRFFARAIAASAAALFVPKQAARADDGGTAPEIEGTWRFDSLPAPQGAAVSLQTFARGGVFLESAVLIGGTTAIPRTTSQGVWEKIGPHLYLKTFEYFVGRPSGDIVTVLRVKIREAVLVEGDLLTIRMSKLTRYNLDGSPHSDAPCVFPNSVGTRLRAEVPSCP
jgi:hypothetical protein